MIRTPGRRLVVCHYEVIHEVFAAAGVEFIPENGGGAGVRLRKATP